MKNKFKDLLLLMMLLTATMVFAFGFRDTFGVTLEGKYLTRPSWVEGEYIGAPYRLDVGALSSTIFIKSIATPTWEVWEPTEEDRTATDYVEYIP